MKNTTTSRRSITDLSLPSTRQDEYLHYLGFRRNPFPVSPDVENFFLPPRTDTMLTEILHGIYTRKGFMVITGEVGLGKTTLSQHILHILEEEGRVETALVLNTFLQGTELLSEIIRDFGLQTEDTSHQGQLAILNNFLIERYRAGSNCAVIIDDAQNLSLESLELIRMISNLETDASKLVQILLVGQPEFQEKLEAHSLRQLKSRIMIHATVEPLDRDALQQYVFFKMSAAGGSGGISVPESCFDLMHRLTEGNPRLVNRLMDRMLYGLFAYSTTRVNQRLLTEVATEIGLSVPKTEWKRRVTQSTVTALAVLGLINLMFTAKQWISHQVEIHPVVNEQRMDHPTVGLLRPDHAKDNHQAVTLPRQDHPSTVAHPTESQNYANASPSLQNEETFTQPEQTMAPSALPEVERFLEYYGLEAYAVAFTQALGTNFESLTQRIWHERGYRLVQLPEQAKGIKGRYRILRQSSAEGEVKRLLFWQPNYWIDKFASGEEGEKILAMQKQLAKINFYHAFPDGIVGNQTVTSLIGFQKRYQLSVTGKPDAATLFILNQQAGNLPWGIQIASLQRLEDASALMNSLSQKGFKSSVKPLRSDNGQAWQVVQVGPLTRYADAEAQRKNILTQLNLTGRIIQFIHTGQESTIKG